MTEMTNIPLPNPRPFPTYPMHDIDYINKYKSVSLPLWIWECFENPIVSIPENIQSYLTCCVCRDIPRDPVLPKCNHKLCIRCLSKLSPPHCPICREPINRDEIRGVVDFVGQELRLINEFTEVHCYHRCGYTGPATRVVLHERSQCPLRYVKCPNFRCNIVGPFDKIQKDHYPTCQFQLMVCETCGQPRYMDPSRPHNCLKAALRCIDGKIYLLKSYFSIK